MSRRVCVTLMKLFFFLLSPPLGSGFFSAAHFLAEQELIELERKKSEKSFEDENSSGEPKLSEQDADIIILNMIKYDLMGSDFRCG